MADPTIRIIVEAATKAAEQGLKRLGSVVKDAGKEAEKSDSAWKKLKSSWTEMNQAAELAMKGVRALKKVMEFGKEGAAILQTTDSFNNLMESLGKGSGVLESLRQASRGTVDDLTLMSSTLTVMAGASDEVASALADNAPRLLEIAKAANKLNPTLGDTSYMYQSIAQGIKRSSTLILDNLGLTIKIGEATQAWADKLGVSVEELSAQDKQMALLNATLEAGDQLIKQVGGSTEAMGDKFAQAEAQLKNTTNELKTRLVPALTSAAEEFNRFLIVAGGQLPEELAKTAEAAEDTGKSLTQMAEEARKAKALLIYGGTEQKEAKLFWVDMTDKVKLTADELVGLGLAAGATWPEILKVAEAAGIELDRGNWADYAEEVLNAKNAVDVWIERQEEAERRARNMGSNLESLEGSMLGVGAAFGPLATGANVAFDAMGMLEGAIGGVNNVMGLVEGYANAWDNALRMKAAAAAEKFRGELELLQMAIKSTFTEDWQEYQANIDGLTNKLEMLKEQEAELSQQPLVSNSQRDRLVDLRDDIAETTTKLEEAKVAYQTLLSEGASEEQIAKAQAAIEKWQGKLEDLNTTVGRVNRDIRENTSTELEQVRRDIRDTTAEIEDERRAWQENTNAVIYNIAEKQILDALEKNLIADTNASGTAYDEASAALMALGVEMGLVDENMLALHERVTGITEDFITGKTKTEDWTSELGGLEEQMKHNTGEAKKLADQVRDIPERRQITIDGNFDEAKGKADGVASSVRGIPTHVKIVIETITKGGSPKDLFGDIDGGGTTGGGTTGGGDTGVQPFQHGGQFMVRGPAGPDRVPIAFRATAGEIVTVTPAGMAPPPNPNPAQAVSNYNLTIHTSAAAESALSDFSIMRTLAGV